MALAERQATIVWEGSLTGGQGRLSLGSGVLHDSPVGWSARVEQPGGRTSPEELLAAAEAECYVMVLSNMLTQQGNEPERLQVTATCAVERVDPGLKITTMTLEVSGTVAGVDEAAFRELAQRAEQSCPVSNAIRGNVQVSVQAHLD